MTDIVSSSFGTIRHWHLRNNPRCCIHADAYFKDGCNWGTALLFLHLRHYILGWHY